MAELLFRDATTSDLGRIVEIYNSTVESRMVTADTEPVSIESRIDWFKAHNPQTRPLWIVEDPSYGIIGWVSFQSFYGRSAYAATAEISIYLESSHRSKGKGRQILQHCILRAPQLGIKTLLGFIFAHNEQSLRLFKAFGFEEWAFLPNIAVLDGLERGLKILGKRLDSIPLTT